MTRKFRILMIAPTPYFSDRGCHVRIYEEAKALKARGHEVVIVTYHLGRVMGDIPVVRIPNIPWYKKQSAGPSWHKPYLDILLLYKALVAAKQFQPDIIHAHLHEGAFLAALAKRSFKAPIVFDCQGSLVGELLDHGFMKQGGVLHRAFSKLEAWITRQADHIVTSSTSTAGLISKEFPEISDHLTPLVDAVDTDIFKPLEKDEQVRNQLGVPHDKKIIVYLGAMTSYQGVDLLLEALKVLAESRSDFHALLMGYPDAQYRDKTKEMNLNEVVTFTGKIDYSEASRYLAIGDVAVSPKLSVTEANGKLLNYMACGLPCVVFDNPINRELLDDCGTYVKDQTASAFAQSMSRLLDNQDVRADLATCSRTYAEQYHCWDARIEVLEEIYYQAVNQKRV